jgi:predicted nucleic acid-binding protein
MNGTRFVDTNILLYSVSTDPAEVRKARAARSILDAGGISLSVQVLQEFYVQATRKTRPDPLSHNDALAFIEKWQRFPVQDMTLSLMLAAMEAKVRWQISYWDAAIIEAARACGCREILSEDLNAGQNYGGINVTNPF